MNNLNHRIVEEETLNAILSTVCNIYQVTKGDIESKSRVSEFIEPRQICLALGYSFTRNSQTAVGIFFGGKDHALVNHSVKKVNDMVKTEPQFKETLLKAIQHISLLSKIHFNLQDIECAGMKIKSKAPRRPSLVDAFNERLLTLLEGKNTDVMEELTILRKLHFVIKKEAA